MNKLYYQTCSSGESLDNFTDFETDICNRVNALFNKFRKVVYTNLVDF